jgi:hypothetical protein
MTREGVKPAELEMLAKPIPPEQIKQRPGARRHDGNCEPPRACRLPHIMLDYIDARTVMDRLDELGADVWQDQYVDRADGSVRCGLSVLVDGEWVTKWDVGTESDIESDKGSYSDAFKRAAVKWGIGRELYGPTTSGSAGALPRAAASTPRPVVTPAPAGDVPPEPEFLAAVLDHTTTTERARDEADGKDGFCPVHGFAWILQPAGVAKGSGKAYGAFWKCPDTNRPWCQEKPSERWMALHEKG